LPLNFGQGLFPGGFDFNDAGAAVMANRSRAQETAMKTVEADTVTSGSVIETYDLNNTTFIEITGTDTWNSSNNQMSGHIVYDLGIKQEVVSFECDVAVEETGGAAASSLRLESSNDNATWTLIADIEGAGSGVEARRSIASGDFKARYVRVGVKMAASANVYVAKFYGVYISV